MCIVIDTNTLSNVFNPANIHHPDFKSVLDWIWNGPGFVVYGGSTYNKELRSARKYLPIFGELEKKAKVARVKDHLVDDHEKKVINLINDPRCDDAHLIAIFRVSGCRLLCSTDKRADSYIKNPDYYLPGQRPPSIYRNRGHRSLLSKQNIVNIQNRK